MPRGGENFSKLGKSIQILWILWLSPLLVCEWDRCPLLWWTCQYMPI
jgi:hypothetical protein